MKVTNPNHAGQDISGLKNKKSSKLDDLETLGQNPKAKGSDNLGKQEAAKVDLSERAQEMKKIKELAMRAPDVNVDKVKKLQELIDKGEYKVDAKNVADKMVDDHLTMSAMSDE